MSDAYQRAWEKALNTRPKNFTYDQWVEFVNRVKQPKDVRLGQFWYNELWAARPDLSERVTKSRAGVDPYDNDANLLRFFNYLEDVWSE